MSDGDKPKLEVVEDDEPIQVHMPGVNVYPLETKTDRQRAECINRLRMLLNEAEQGQLRDLMILTFRDDGTQSFHWTPVPPGELPRFVGLLLTMAVMLVGRMARFDDREV